MKSLRLTLALLTVTLIGAALAGAMRDGPVVQVKATEDLALTGAQSARKQVPILLVFSADHCPYCDLLENEILKPMILSGEYSERVVIRKVMTDINLQVQDFSGKTIDTDALMTRYGVFVTPTILFLNPQGDELAERLIGINTVEMFGGLVDAAIDHSLLRMRTGKHAANYPVK